MPEIWTFSQQMCCRRRIRRHVDLLSEKFGTGIYSTVSLYSLHGFYGNTVLNFNLIK
jgi:hypothetical protein